MKNTKNKPVIEVAPEIPITMREYAVQNNVCPKTVEQWFKHGKKVVTINLDLADKSNCSN